MTSKNAFGNMTLAALRSRIWGIALSFVLLFFSLPIFGAMYASVQTNSIFLQTDVKYKLLLRMYRSWVLGEENVFTTGVIIFLAVFLAVNGFMYLFSRQKTDMYHSLPIKRNLLFAANYLAGLIAFVVPYILFTIAAIAVGRIYHMVNIQSVIVAVQMVVINILGFLLIYSVSSALIMLTGNMQVSICSIIIFNLYGPVVFVLQEMYKKMFYITYSSRMSDDMWTFCSPLTLYFKLQKIDSFGKNPEVDLVLMICMLAAIVFFTAAGLILYIKRPIECAGRSIVYKKTIPFLSILILVPLSIGGGGIFGEVSNCGKTGNYGWFIFGLIATVIIGHFILQTVYYLDFKSLFKNMTFPVVALVIAALISVCYIFDLTGYDTYIPNDDVSSLAITSYALHSAQEYYDFDKEMSEWGNTQYWVESNSYRFDHMKIKDVDTCVPFLEKAVSESFEYDKLQNLEGSDEDNWVNIEVLYNTKTGRKKYRSYMVRMDNLIDDFNSVYSLEDYKNAVYPILTEDEEKLSENLYFNDSIGEINLLAAGFTQEDIKELSEVYKKELLEQDAFSLKDSVPMGYICSKYDEVNDEYTSSYTYNRGYIYPSFTRTIDILEKHGIDFNRYKDVDNIDKIVVENYNVKDVNADSIRRIYTDPEDIQKVLETAVPYELAMNDDVFHNYANLDITIYYKEAVGKDLNSISIGYEKELVPDIVKSDVGLE